MKANELKIGDWVLYDKQPHKVRKLGIYGANHDGSDYPAICVGKPNGVGLILEINDIEPIPLTPEILKKIDLKIGNVTEYLGYDIYSDEEGTFGVSEDHEGFVFETYKRWEEKDCDGAPIDWGFYPVNRIKGIRYFHELQHALRLCGIDKEIIL